MAVGRDASVNGAPISFSDAMMCARRVGGSAVRAMFIVVEVVSAVVCIKKKFTHVLCAAWQKKGGVVAGRTVGPKSWRVREFWRAPQRYR